MTALIFLFIWLITVLPINLDFLNPIEQAFSDFDTSDIVFSKLREEPPADTNIVVVNIGYLSRVEIARELNIVSKCKPKVIGMDIFFSEHKNPHEDSLLAKAIAGFKNVVLVSRLVNFNKETGLYGDVSKSIDIFQDAVYSGYGNLPGSEEGNILTVRTFEPKVNYKNSTYKAFPVKIAELYNRGNSEFLLNRDNESEIINYRGNKDKFYYLDTGELEKPDVNLDFLKGKIVLFGFTGNRTGPKILEDIFFTPLNNIYAGKTLPDMHGILIHANIISMIINKNYINTMPGWINFLLALIICYLNVVMVSQIKLKFADWFDSLTIVFVIIESILLLFLSLEIFLYLNFKISLTITLVTIVLLPDAFDAYENLSIKLQPALRKIKDKIII